jgi:phosphotransferase system HPr (HPr) family protein
MKKENQAGHVNQNEEPLLLSDGICEATFLVHHTEGLHARPAALFVKTAMGFDSKIEVLNGDKAANAKSLIGILSLAVMQGTEIRIRAEGSDAKAAVSALHQLVESNFGD